MDHILATKRFTESQLLRINYCRLYLNAHTVSDIATACRRFLCPLLLKGDLVPIDRNWKTNHLIQEKPSDNSQKIWNRACTMICLYRRRKTIRPLGPWTVPYSKIQRHRFLHSNTTNTVYRLSVKLEHEHHLNGNVWYRFPKHPLPYRHLHVGQTVSEKPPLDSIPVYIQEDSNTTLRAIPTRA